MIDYGERDYRPDDSFVTTQFFAVGYLPLFPIISRRISYTRNSDYSNYDPDGYFVCEMLPLDRRQVLFVYGWFAAIIAPLLVWATFEDALANFFGDDDIAAGLCLVCSAVAFVFPYFLRRWAKRRKMEEWKRQSLGMHGRPL
jgi:hypothetical protein